MSRRRYKYSFGVREYIITALHLLLYVVVGFVLYFVCSASFVVVWYLTFAVALLALMSLSIPRYIEVDDRSLTIGCLLDVTEIEIEDIVRVEKVSPRKINRSFPLFGGNGLFGYYGHFFDLRHFRHIIIYATQRRNLVEIVDVYEDHYYLSCNRRDDLISELSMKICLIEAGAAES